MPAIQTLARMRDINGYTTSAAATKRRFHSSGRAFLQQLARDLGLPPDARDIRSNEGGMAVSGEVTLHADHLYVQLSESWVGPGGVLVLHRACRDRKDYSGYVNHHVLMRDLAEPSGTAYGRFVATCRLLMQHGAALAH